MQRAIWLILLAGCLWSQPDRRITPNPGAQARAAYRQQALANPANDARDVATRLREGLAAK